MSKIQAKGKKQVVESDSEEEQEIVTKKQKVTNAKANVKAPATKTKKVESDDDSEEEVKPSKQGKTAQKTAQKANAKAPAKKEESSDASDDEEQQKPASKSQPKQNGANKAQPKKQEESEEEEETPKVKNVQSEETGSHEIIVKGLPFTSSENDVKEFFAECGSIDRVNLLKGHDGRSKGIAFVTFNNANAVTTAISYTGSDFGGRSVTIEKTTPRDQRAPAPAKGGFQQKSERDPTSSSVFVGNLSYQTTEDSLRGVFEACGKIANIRVATDQEGNPRGFAHIDFASPDSVEKAVSKAGAKVDGRAIRVDYSTPKKQDGGNRGGQRGFGGGFGGGRGGRRY